MDWKVILFFSLVVQLQSVGDLIYYKAHLYTLSCIRIYTWIYSAELLNEASFCKKKYGVYGNECNSMINPGKCAQFCEARVVGRLIKPYYKKL